MAEDIVVEEQAGCWDGCLSAVGSILAWLIAPLFGVFGLVILGGLTVADKSWKAGQQLASQGAFATPIPAQAIQALNSEPTAAGMGGAFVLAIVVAIGLFAIVGRMISSTMG